ncbi:major facilitator superfamily domain-containing protein [Suillus clintonianus]|uniref:major facilitator superfamily domain-containing protein n=1 Tax=Suillus clintonianus TaxID=1904413 RepID=UPI001B85C712|nr:major facilitator superfamily domain-containing protein [Suillus clintonianus]KAG2144581.1 major facilitator superfamily domain-containing protein [Suillus clintonianus]
MNFSYKKKWTITLVACAFTGIIAAASASFSMGYQSMMRDLNCTQFQATVGLSMWAIGFGTVPLITSSFTEEFGRLNIYIVSSFAFMLTEMMIALSPNIQIVMIGRLLGGAFGSTGATLVGGSIADVWKQHERGQPMAFFALVAVAGTGLGPLIAGVIEYNPRLGWRWIQWVHVMFTGAYFISVVLFMKETRATIVLTRLASKKRKETGDDRYQAKIEKQHLITLIKISCTRPIYLLLTEPIVQSFSLWIGFTWGVVFALVESVSDNFQAVYGFNVQDTGFVFSTLIVGSFVGYFANIYQENLYQKHYSRKRQEARLYLPCVAAIFIPTGIFIYAWTARPDVHWIAPAIGITIFMSGAFVIYMVVFLYIADCYGTYASSAIACQSLSRNLSTAAFPLFTTQMFAGLTHRWGLTLFGCIGAALVPIPWVLFFYGSRIRARSKVSRKILEEEELRDNMKK